MVRDERAALMARIREQLDREAEAFGIKVVDVRIRRADLPEQNSQAVYQRMQTERQREAAEFRAQGTQRAQEIRVARRPRRDGAGRRRAVARPIRSAAKAMRERNRIFAEAFGRDPDFFAFYRSMQAYEAGLEAQRYPHGAASRTPTSSAISPIRAASRAKTAKRTVPRRQRRCIAAADGRPRRAGACGMSDFVVALGLVFVLEGLLFAGFPGDGEAGDGAARWRPRTATLRMVGIVSAVLGVVADRGWCAG